MNRKCVIKGCDKDCFIDWFVCREHFDAIRGKTAVYIYVKESLA